MVPTTKFAACFAYEPNIESSAANAASLLYAVAGRNQAAGEIILDVANPGAQAVTAEIDLRGAARLTPQAKAIVLTSASPDDENSMEFPMKVSPREESLAISSPSFRHAFPACSFTVLRLKIAK